MKLTKRQKYYGVLTVLANAKYPLTTNGVGLALGYVNGEPIKATLDDMILDGLVTVYREKMFGHECKFWFLQESGYVVLEKERDVVAYQLGI